MSEFTGAGVACFRGERTVFEGVHFTLGQGGLLMLRGANGSGKSSLLRLMAGLAPATAGTIAWDGAAIGDDPEAHNRRLHYLGHADPVKAVLSVAENLAFWARMRGGDGGRDSVQRALQAFGIGHLGPVPGRFLSAGQRRRVNLARLLAAPAELWLLDEPATALDAHAAKGLDAAIAEHRAGGGRIVLATHDDAPPGAGTLDMARFEAQP